MFRGQATYTLHNFSFFLRGSRRLEDALQLLLDLEAKEVQFD